MVLEFNRYRLQNFRILTGVLELLGGIGTLVGLFYPVPFLISTFGLASLMFLGVLVRIRSKDPWLHMMPAIFLMMINLYLFADRLITN